MSEVYMMITITSRQKLPAFLAFYEKKLPVGFVSLGYGTVKDEILDLLGLDRSEKAVCLHTVTGEVWKETKGHLRRKLYIDMPDTGIAFIVPMSSIGGKRELAYLTAGQDYRKGEESVMKDTTLELLVIVSNQGHNDLVMDAARGAVARERLAEEQEDILVGQVFAPEPRGTVDLLHRAHIHIAHRIPFRQDDARGGCRRKRRGGGQGNECG